MSWKGENDLCWHQFFIVGFFSWKEENADMDFFTNSWPKRGGSYLIFVIFSPGAQFLAQFISTLKRVNHTKTDFATEQRKMWQNTMNRTYYFSTLQILVTFLMWKNISTCQSVMWRISQHDNLSCGEIFLHNQICN